MADPNEDTETEDERKRRLALAGGGDSQQSAVPPPPSLNTSMLMVNTHSYIQVGRSWALDAPRLSPGRELGVEAIDLL